MTEVITLLYKVLAGQEELKKKLRRQEGPRNLVLPANTDASVDILSITDKFPIENEASLKYYEDSLKMEEFRQIMVIQNTHFLFRIIKQVTASRQN